MGVDQKNRPVDQDWIKRYVDQLLELASKLPTGPMRDACLLRADHVMDLVKSWQEKGDNLL